MAQGPCHCSTIPSREERFGCLQFFNYVNPVCCVATVCHQVRCIYWGHLGHFYRTISHLKWYKIVCMRYLASTFSQMKSINMFSMFSQPGVPRHFSWRFIAVENKTSLFSCVCISMLTPNSSSNMQKHGYLGCFHVASCGENISGVWGIVYFVLFYS